MNADAARLPVWSLSVRLAALMVLFAGAGSAGAELAVFAPSPATPVPATLAQKTQTGKNRTTAAQALALPAALNTVFQKDRSAALRIEDCPSVADDPTCKEPNGIGSGVLVSADGQVLTAYHVVFGSTRLEAVTLDKKRYPITVLGFDEPHDLALLKINISGATYVPITPQAPRIGQAALAIGNAGGKFLQPKAGKLLALDAAAGRADFPPGTLQLDAPLAPGDSGGPILNEAGQLIGITSYIRLDSSPSGDVGQASAASAEPRFSSYAVPVTAGSDLLAQLRSGVKREAPVVGISTDPSLTEGLTLKFFQELGLGSQVGYVFNQVVKGGPADVAGLHPLVATKFDDKGVPTHATGDVITAVDGQAVTDYLEFLAVIRSHQVGDQVTLTIIRDGASKPLNVMVTLAPRTVSLGQTRP